MLLFNRRLIVFGWIAYCFARLSCSDIRCFEGPDFWCLNETTESLCNFTNKTIGACGSSVQRCEIKTGDSFCKSYTPDQQQSSLAYKGGLNRAESNLFSYYIFSLYWPPSACPTKYNENTDFLKHFCSPYTDSNQPGSERLVLHGLWAQYSTKGNYTIWPEFCSSTNMDWSKCHINGNLCPWKNATSKNFTQLRYDYCLSVENIQECLVNATSILVPIQERLKVLAPGYLGPRNLFINREWSKHGSCFSTIYGNNISNYLTHMLDLVDHVTQPGSLTYEYIQLYAGKTVRLETLIANLNQTTITRCNSKCELLEVYMCMNRDDHTGLPDRFIPCPLGALNALDSCRTGRCEYVSIPLRDPSRRTDSDDSYFSSIWAKIVFLIFIIILYKCLVFFCATC